MLSTYFKCTDPPPFTKLSENFAISTGLVILGVKPEGLPLEELEEIDWTTGFWDKCLFVFASAGAFYFTDAFLWGICSFGSVLPGVFYLWQFKLKSFFR